MTVKSESVCTLARVSIATSHEVVKVSHRQKSGGVSSMLSCRSTKKHSSLTTNNAAVGQRNSVVVPFTTRRCPSAPSTQSCQKPVGPHLQPEKSDQRWSFWKTKS